MQDMDYYYENVNTKSRVISRAVSVSMMTLNDPKTRLERVKL